MDGSRLKCLALGTLAVTSLTVRLAAVCVLSAGDGVLPAYEHGEIARNLLAGKGFSITFLGTFGPTSQQAPIYPALLSAAYWVAGTGTETAHGIVQVLQAFAGTATVLATFWLARSLSPERPSVAWCAAWLVALYPPHIYMVTHLQVVTWACLILVLLLAVVASREFARSRAWPAAGGGLSALVVLIDPILVLALPPAACLAWRTARRCAGGAARHAIARRLAGTVVVFVVAVSPWIWRNYHVHGEFVFIKSTFGYALWQGNNPASWGTDKVPKPLADSESPALDHSWASHNQRLWAQRHETLYIDDVVLKPTGYAQFVGLTEPARSRVLGAQAIEFIRSQPSQYARLCAARCRYFWLFDETNPKAAHPVYRASSAAWLVLTIVGLLCLRPRFCDYWPLLAIVAIVSAFHVLTIVSARFRMPLEPLAFLWSAEAVGPALGRLATAAATALLSRPSPARRESHAPAGPHWRRRGRVRHDSTLSRGR